MLLPIGRGYKGLEGEVGQMSDPGPETGPPQRDIGSASVARLDLRIPDELKAALAKEAERQDLPVSEIAREAMAFYVGWLQAQREQQDEK